MLKIMCGACGEWYNTDLKRCPCGGKKVKKAKRKVVYVLSQEHYHFAPNDTDMVAATPIEVRAGTDTGRIDLKTKAKKLAQKHAERFQGEVADFTTSSNREYRVWVDSPSPHCDKFVWVVREVEYVG